VITRPDQVFTVALGSTRVESALVKGKRLSPLHIYAPPWELSAQKYVIFGIGQKYHHQKGCPMPTD